MLVWDTIISLHPATALSPSRSPSVSLPLSLSLSPSLSHIHIHTISVLNEHGLDQQVGYSQLALMEQTLMSDGDGDSSSIAPPSPLRPVRGGTPGNEARRGVAGAIGDEARGLARPPSGSGVRVGYDTSNASNQSHSYISTGASMSLSNSGNSDQVVPN